MYLRVYRLHYSVDGRERDFSLAERWSDENVFSNRAYFMPEKKPAELGVDHIRETDQGVYRCRVDFKVAQTRNSKVNLTIIGKYQNQITSVLLLSTHIFVDEQLTCYRSICYWPKLVSSCFVSVFGFRISTR